MAIKNQRINVTLDQETLYLLSQLAKRKNQSLAMTARELINEGLDVDEDLYYSSLAAKRNIEDAPRLSHEEFWK